MKNILAVMSAANNWITVKNEEKIKRNVCKIKMVLDLANVKITGV